MTNRIKNSIKYLGLGIKTLKFLLFLILLNTYYLIPTTAHAVVDPLSSPNNKFGIHIISASEDEAKDAASLVNSSGGDWGYVTVLIESGDRNIDKWQQFFNTLRRKHLIPLVRLATHPEAGAWKKPYDGEEIAVADFLNNLNWPVKNRYVIVYNEPNHAKEWGNLVNPGEYARVLDKTITALKAKSEDFFVLNAGFDASAPHQPPSYFDELQFIKDMDQEVPGIFDRLDGFTSHSYPNPGFLGSPKNSGRGTVRTWIWEQQLLSSLGVKKALPIFITETGWKHSEGQNYDRSFPSPEVVGEYFVESFQGAWNSNKIVAVTPFLLNYQSPPFDHFSFKKYTGEGQDEKILGAEFPQFHPHFEIVSNIPKNSGRPVQVDQARLTKGGIYASLVSGESYSLKMKFKNTGQSIWGESGDINLVLTTGREAFTINQETLPKGVKVEPNQEAEFEVNFKAPEISSETTLGFELFNGSKKFDQEPILFVVSIKSPVILVVKADSIYQENLLLTTTGTIGDTSQTVTLLNGESAEVEAKHLLPDYPFDFAVSKPFYKSKTVTLRVRSGVNTVDFGSLNLNLGEVLQNPIGFIQSL